MIKESYNIEGMVCAACSSAVEKVTGKLDGVKSSSVNLTTKQLSIEYDEKKCSQEKICSVVEKAGFGISLKDENSSTLNFICELTSFTRVYQFGYMGHFSKGNTDVKHKEKNKTAGN